MTVNDGGASKPNRLSKTVKSCVIVAKPNASTITIVSPSPVTP
jgi:hypothetical protein